MVDLLMDAVPLEGADKGERVFPFPCDPLPADETGATRAALRTDAEQFGGDTRAGTAAANMAHGGRL